MTKLCDILCNQLIFLQDDVNPESDNMGDTRILHECQVWIDKSVLRVTVWPHETRRVMPNCDRRNRFVYSYLICMMDSFSCSLNTAKLDFHTIYLEKCYNHGVCHFELKRFDIIVTCVLNDKITGQF